MTKVSFLLELIYHVLSISKCFRETLVVFDFHEKFTQSIAQITMIYHESKDFLYLHFALDQFQVMTWKWKNAVQGKILNYGSKNS